MVTTKHDLMPLCDGQRLAGGAFVPESPRGLVLLLHGIPSINPPAPGDRGYPGIASDFADHGWATAWVDMRGARESRGYFSIEGWVRDARAAIDAARALDGVAGLSVAVVGSSAGGAVAATVTARGAPVDAVALLAAPAAWVSFATDTAEAMRKITEEAGMPLAPEVLRDPTAWAAEFDQVATEKVISKVRVPVLIVHGTEDELIPVHHAHQLAERAPAGELYIIEGADHVLRMVPEALDAVLAWLPRVL